MRRQCNQERHFLSASTLSESDFVPAFGIRLVEVGPAGDYPLSPSSGVAAPAAVVFVLEGP